MKRRSNTMRYAASVMPPLIAFASFNLVSSGDMSMTLLVQTSGFCGLFVFDALASAYGYAPQWYIRLRLGLTILVSGSMISLAILGYKRDGMMKDSYQEQLSNTHNS